MDGQSINNPDAAAPKSASDNEGLTIPMMSVSISEANGIDVHSDHSMEHDGNNPKKPNGISSNDHLSDRIDTPIEPKEVSSAEPEKEDTTGDPDAEKIPVEGEGQVDGSENDKGAGTQMGIGTKKKKKKKSKSKRGLNAPSGFEEYYVDAPLTPAEYEQEKSISFPFAQRTETAIQRYVAKRKLDSERKRMFDRYLTHGGVEAGPKMFSGGLDKNAVETMNAAEIAEQTATHYVGDGRGEPGDPVWVVDFEGCVKSFLSSQFPSQWDIQSEENLKYLVNIIRNFLNYLLHHDVCPEYKEHINASRTICDLSEQELWSIGQLTPLLPGQFNMACSEIFGGMYQGMYSEDQTWMEGLDIDYECGISPKHARKVFKIAMAATADAETFQRYKAQLEDKTLHTTSVEDTGFEITEITYPDKLAQNLYAQDEYTDLKIVGKLKARTWLSPNKQAEDLTEEEEAVSATSSPEMKYYEFWIEEALLQKCFVGMKFEATVTQLSCGLSYFDAITGVRCSFYTVLPNTMMSGWREIEKEWLPMKRNRHYEAADGDAEEDFDKEEDRDEDGCAGDAGNGQIDNAPEMESV